MLRRLGAAPHVSLLIGTRRSTLEGPDQPDTDDTSLDSLGVPLTDAILVKRDPDAAFDYVRGRITAANLPEVSTGGVVAAPSCRRRQPGVPVHPTRHLRIAAST